MPTLLKLCFWYFLWLAFRFVSAPFRLRKPGQENCMTWAIDKFEREGGYIAIRWCRSSKYDWFRWPHFMWIAPEDHHVLQHVVPVNDTTQKKRVPDPWFDPKQLRGDDHTVVKEN